jgi:AraC-like DNA-binding protein
MERPEEMLEERIGVPEAYTSVFTHFYAAKNISSVAIPKTLIPHFQTMMVFSLGADITLTTKQNTIITIDKCIVLGPVKMPLDYTMHPGSDMLVINFKGDAFYRFFGQAAITGQFSVHPDKLLNRNCFEDLWDVMRSVSSPLERVNRFLETGKHYLKEGDKTIEQISAIDNLTMNPIKSVARDTEQSERSVQLKHKKYLGYSAKEASRFQRFLKTVKQLEVMAAENKKIDWFELIQESGYHDQSQLIRDFKNYLHLSPTRFFIGQDK